MERGVVPTDRIVRSIDMFSEVVTRYLMPVIRFVGHKDDLFDALNRIYPGLVHEREYTGEPADLVIFDRLPIDLIGPTLQLTADAAYIFSLPKSDEQTLPSADVLRHLIALTLIDPEVDEFLWHVKALMLVKELAYSNGPSAFADLLSIDRVQKRALSRVIDAVLNARTCIVTVPSDEYRKVLLDFLFGAMPEVIAPVYIDASSMVLDLLEPDRYNVISGVDINVFDLSAVVKVIERSREGCALMVIVTNRVAKQSKTAASVVAVSLESLAKRPVDAHLIAYWVAAWKSHESGRVTFYSTECINKLREKADNDPVELRRQLMKRAPRNNKPDETLLEVLDVYQRLSLDNILGETERQILLRLKELSPLVESASHAAGIPVVTFHKRTRRLANKTSLIELLSSTRKPWP